MTWGPTLTKQKYGFLVALFNVSHVLVYVAWILGMVNRVKSRVLGFIMILLTFIFMTMVPELTRQRDGSLLVSLTSGVVDLHSCSFSRKSHLRLFYNYYGK